MRWSDPACCPSSPLATSDGAADPGRTRRIGLDRDGRSSWIVAEHGHEANYVRNIEANPSVRVRVGRTWHTGRAHLLPDDDPHARLRTIGRPVNALMVRAMGTDLLTVRIDLEGTARRTRSGPTDE